jgi:hypothetical protein
MNLRFTPQTLHQALVKVHTPEGAMQSFGIPENWEDLNDFQQEQFQIMAFRLNCIFGEFEPEPVE